MSSPKKSDNPIIQILIDRDGLHLDSAITRFMDGRQDISDALKLGKNGLAEELMDRYFGLSLYNYSKYFN